MEESLEQEKLDHASTSMEDVINLQRWVAVMDTVCIAGAGQSYKRAGVIALLCTVIRKIRMQISISKQNYIPHLRQYKAITPERSDENQL